MRLLLDECVDQRLRLLFTGHEVQTAAYAGFAGVKNGALLEAAETAGFEVIVNGSGDSISAESRTAAGRDPDPLRPNESFGRSEGIGPCRDCGAGQDYGRSSNPDRVTCRPATELNMRIAD
jgi:hypothetical protein